MLAALVLALALVLPAAPEGRVNDYAGLLSAPDRARLEAFLAERERATGAQVVIAIFPSLEGESLEDVSIRLAEQWRIGRKGQDDGVILLVFAADRQLRLEVGYGLEPVIPDAVARRIISELIVPRFREGRHADGLEAAAAAVYRRIGDARGAPAPRRPAGGPAWPVVGFFGILALIALVLAWETMRTRRHNRGRFYTRGPRGWYVPSGPMWRYPRGGWYGGWGGGWRGGGGGGGFSGGGGSFGGGGASGRW